MPDISSLSDLEEVLKTLSLTEEEKQKVVKRFKALKTPSDYQSFQSDLNDLELAEKILEIDAQTIEALNNQEELKNADRQTLVKIVEEQKRKQDKAQEEALRNKLKSP